MKARKERPRRRGRGMGDREARGGGRSVGQIHWPRTSRPARRARLEQRVEDYNALQKASGTFHRAVLVLPLTPEFDPPRGQPGHGRVQFSDRVSASASVGKELTRRALEVPWHFKLEPLVRNDDEELVEELGFEEVRPTRRLGKDPLESAAQGETRRRVGQLGHRRRAAPETRVLLAVGLSARRRTSCSCRSGCYAPTSKAVRRRLHRRGSSSTTRVTIELQPHQDAFLQLVGPRSFRASRRTSSLRGQAVRLRRGAATAALDAQGVAIQDALRRSGCFGHDGTHARLHDVGQAERWRHHRAPAAPGRVPAAREPRGASSRTSSSTTMPATREGRRSRLLYEGKQYDFDVTDCVGRDGTQLDAYNPERCEGVADPGRLCELSN